MSTVHYVILLIVLIICGISAVTGIIIEGINRRRERKRSNHDEGGQSKR